MIKNSPDYIDDILKNYGDNAVDGFKSGKTPDEIKADINSAGGSGTGNDIGEEGGLKSFKEINIHGKINTELDEVDLKNMIIYEDKDASGLYRSDLDFPQTELQWDEKQILEKGKNRIRALQQEDFTLSSLVSSELPSIEELKQIRTLVCRINADTDALRSAVQSQVDEVGKVISRL